MTTKTIRGGLTRSLAGVLQPGDTLNIQGGGLAGQTGGIGIVSSSAVDAGQLRIAAGQGTGAAGTLSVVSTGTLTVTGGSGTSGPGPSQAGGTIANAGVVTNSGSLLLNGGDGGGMYVSPDGGKGGQGAVLRNSGVLSNTGSLVVGGGEGGAYYLAGGGAGATLINAGVLTSNGHLDILGGQGGVTGYTGGGYGGVLIDAGQLTNSGTVTVAGGASSYYRLGSGGSGLSGTLSVTGILSNAGTILLEGGVSYGPAIKASAGALLSDTGDLTNSGSIAIGAGRVGGDGFLADGAELRVTGVLTDSGAISVDSTAAYPQYGDGTLAVASSGTLAITGGAGSPNYGPGGAGGLLSNAGVMTNNGVLQIDGGGGGRAYVSPGGYGGQLVDSGVLTNTGDIQIGGGTGGVSGFGGYNGGGWGGTLAVTGTLTNDSLITAAAGVRAHYFNSFAGAGAVIDDIGTLTNHGTIALSGAAGQDFFNAQRPGAQFTVRGRFDDTGLVTLAGPSDGYHGAVMDVTATGTATLSGAASIEGSGLITNEGTIQGFGTIAAGRLVNNGSVAAMGGRLTIESRLLGAGALAVSSGATLALEGTVGGTNAVTLASASSVLELLAPAAGIAVHSASGGMMTIGGGGVATLDAADTHLVVSLSQATNLTLSSLGFIDAQGSSFADTITALSSGQTLTGGLGADMLAGAAATGDIFLDTAAGLNGDVLTGFAGSDVIDLTDIAAGGASLAYTQHVGEGTLVVTNGTASSTITLLGSFTIGQFNTASDGHGGLLVDLKP